MGVGGEPLKAIEWGALLHYVGKMVVPDRSCARWDRSPTSEWHIMRQHPPGGSTCWPRWASCSRRRSTSSTATTSAGTARAIRAASLGRTSRSRPASLPRSTPTTPSPPTGPTAGRAPPGGGRRAAAGGRPAARPAGVAAFRNLPEVELRRLRELCKRIHPGLSLPADLLDSLAEPEGAEGGVRGDLEFRIRAGRGSCIPISPLRSARVFSRKGRGSSIGGRFLRRPTRPGRRSGARPRRSPGISSRA